ncbi:MAG TPA: M23 family metallopeptidase [Caulobacteraceae bacterium]|nr:M23 family metallopeptidase [Caulobacteraceae bacterium]
MSQPAATAVQSHWVADWVVGVAGALAAFAVAQAAIPREDGGAMSRPAPALRGVQQISTAPAVDRPDFIFGEPVDGYEVVSPFGLRKLPWELSGRLHAGVDIAAPSGYPVQAFADGVVTYAGYKGGYGQMVEVAHAEGIRTVYAHLGGLAVKPGAKVRVGDRLGQVGNSGSSTGAHLHFEVRDRKKRPLNPSYFMGKEFETVRDLPLKQAARVPRGMRIAYVSYIPKPKRELMERRAAEAAAKAAEEAGFDPKLAAEAARAAIKAGADQKAAVAAAMKAGVPASPSLTVRNGKAGLSEPQVVKLTPAEEDTQRIAEWKPDAWKVSTDPAASWTPPGLADAPMSTF